MKRTTISFLLVLFIMFALCACSQQRTDIKEGKYYLDNGKNDIYIVVSDYTRGGEYSNTSENYIGCCNIQFFNYDFSELNKSYIEQSLGIYLGSSENSKDIDENKMKSELEKNIDVKKQFSDNPCKVGYGCVDNKYVIYSDVSGTEITGNPPLNFPLIYDHSDNSITLNEQKFILKSE